MVADGIAQNIVLSRLVSRPMLERGRSSKYKWILQLLAHEYTLDTKLCTARMGNTKKRWYLLEEMEMAQEGSSPGTSSVSLSVVPFHFISLV